MLRFSSGYRVVWRNHGINHTTKSKSRRFNLTQYLNQFLAWANVTIKLLCTCKIITENHFIAIPHNIHIISFKFLFILQSLQRVCYSSDTFFSNGASHDSEIIKQQMKSGQSTPKHSPSTQNTYNKQQLQLNLMTALFYLVFGAWREPCDYESHFNTEGEVAFFEQHN